MSESAYQNLAQLAAEITGTSSAAIAFINDQRQYVRGMIGIDDHYCDWLLSVCVYAAKQNQRINVADATQHSWLRKHPIVRQTSRIRQFASLPIQDTSSCSAGILCVFGNAIRRLSEPEIHHLSSIAEQAGLIHQLSRKQKPVAADKQTREAICKQERLRIARDWHDELGQHLAMLKLDLTFIKQQSEGVMSEAISAAIARVDQAVRSTRNLINCLRVPELALGLVPAMKHLVRQYASATKTQYIFMPDDFSWADNIPEAVCLTLYRCLQEALNNSMRHAQASTVRIRLWTTTEAIHLQVADNGMLVEPAMHNLPLSWGLTGMRERIQAVNGNMTFQSLPGCGTVLDICLPCQPAPYTQNSLACIGIMNTLHQ